MIFRPAVFLLAAALLSIGDDATALDQASVKRGYAEGPYGFVHYYEAKPETAGASVPLILFHENPTSGRGYSEILSYLGTKRRAIAIDMPGYGRSDPPPGPVSYEEYAVAIMTALRNAGIGSEQKIDVLGHHGGALLATEFAVRFPTQVRRVILSGIPYRLAETKTIEPSNRNEKPEDSEAWFDALWARAFSAKPDSVSADDIASIVVETMLPMQRRWYASATAPAYDLPANLRRIRQPVLVLLMHESLYENSKRALTEMPTARALEAPEARSFGYIDAAAPLAKTIAAFLDSPTP